MPTPGMLFPIGKAHVAPTAAVPTVHRRRRMKQVRVPTYPAEDAFRYYCPICGIELALSNYETAGDQYYCPYCSTEQWPSRVLRI